ncbi:MAG: RecB family exonuclease, partial [Candidatus Lutacidiplasmatales archaeon]
MAAVPTLSYSGVRAYLECPLRWKFLYIDKLTEAPRGYFTFGRTVHSVLEELLEPLVVPVGRRLEAGRTQKTLMEFSGGRTSASTPLMPEEQMRSAYDRLWSSEGYLSTEEEGRYRELGWTILKRFRENLVASPPSPVAVEPHLEARWDGIPVHGYIDRIDRNVSGGLEIVDYKTTKELSQADAQGSDQLTLYQVLVESNFPGQVETLTLYHLRRQQPLRTPRRDRGALEELYDRVGLVHDGIRTESYEPKPGRHCSRCEFQSRCPEFRSVPENEGERLRTLVDRFALLRREEERLDGELRLTADELHRTAQVIGVHRVPGTAEVLLRRHDESWAYPVEEVRAALVQAGVVGKVDPSDPKAARRFLRD